MLTLYDLLKLYDTDFDVWDDTYDASVTVCLPDEIEDDYDTFCCEICKKVEPVRVTNSYTLVADWTKLIQNNMEKFRAFSNKYWVNQYDDVDDFICEWISEIHAYMAGYVADDFYATLVSFVNTLD